MNHPVAKTETNKCVEMTSKTFVLISRMFKILSPKDHCTLCSFVPIPCAQYRPIRAAVLTTEVTDSSLASFKLFRYAPHNDVSVYGPHMRRWPHNIIILKYCNIML